MNLQTVHPFPARMAAEIALGHLWSVNQNGIVVDPMAGSGTVLRVASELGLRGIGFDLDPLAVLMAKVWTTPVDAPQLSAIVDEVLDRARDTSTCVLPWIDGDLETQRFIAFWFGPQQINQLRHLSYVISSYEGVQRSFLQLCLSKIIVTKDNGASLARDVSHSRPHRVMVENDFDVFSGFQRAATRLLKVLSRQNRDLQGNITVALGDASNLVSVPSSSVDCVITSPPYLNAIDYIRGHKLALVWMGYTVSELRDIRAMTIGSKPSGFIPSPTEAEMASVVQEWDALPRRVQKIVARFALDMFGVMREVKRILKDGANATFVIGNSQLAGVSVSNSDLIAAIGHSLKLSPTSKVEREIMAQRRYLPPPKAELRHPALSKRMTYETILTFTNS